MSEQTSECVRSVTAMIPMPVSHVAEEYAKMYCAWGVPASVAAMAILEFLLGPGKAKWGQESPNEHQLAIGRALAEGRGGIDRLKEAAAALDVKKRMAVWHDICKHLGPSASLSERECRDIYFQVLSGKIKNVADADDALSRIRAQPIDTLATEKSNKRENSPTPD
ncbi:hypothetical protein GGR75_000394 [Xanthomonas campestris]|uniref:hypothetical protein n=1 Tax=Xanthomonas campestris TaxID=339 RepID=UPI002E0925A9|nr:hypothetical protein [Xanthomonas campestris]